MCAARESGPSSGAGDVLMGRDLSPFVNAVVQDVDQAQSLEKRDKQTHRPEKWLKV
jgi:hypothetical protein